jgi:RNAse (barnase) inhibitor barstar
VVTLDAGSGDSAREMFGDVAQALDFPESFGRNLDALNDCMRDVVAGDYGWRGMRQGWFSC